MQKFFRRLTASPPATVTTINCGSLQTKRIETPHAVLGLFRNILSRFSSILV